MLPLPPRSTRTDTLFPYTTLFRSAVVLNATELRTGTAFRFGSKESGSWRYGRLVKTPTVSAAVAASAAFPALLPLFDEHLVFENSGSHARRRVMLTDGGVYDNLGISCLLPGRSAAFRSEERRVGKECVSTCRSRWSPYH